MTDHSGEVIVRRAIEDQGYVVQSANLVIRANCPNIDLIVYGKRRATYIQVKSSTFPSNKASVCVDGSPWSESQLFDHAPIFNRIASSYRAELIAVVDRSGAAPEIYLVPPATLERALRRLGLAFAAKPKKRGGKRAIRFRKELPRKSLERWRQRWDLLESL